MQIYLISGLSVARPQADRFVEVIFASSTVQTKLRWEAEISKLISIFVSN